MAKILVVDDDPSIVSLLHLRLSESGHTVVTALDGAAGTAAVVREKPDLVILDFNMPAANGAKVHERIRVNAVNGVLIPVIFLTASPVAEIIMQVKDDPKTRFLQKPVDFPLLAKTIAALLGAPAPRAAPPPAAPRGPDAAAGSGDAEILDLDA